MNGTSPHTPPAPLDELREYAIDLLISGLTITQTAAAVGRHKGTVSRWIAAAGLDLPELRGVACQACGATLRKAHASAKYDIHLCRACYGRRTALWTAASGPLLRCEHCGRELHYRRTSSRHGSYCRAPACNAAYLRERRQENPVYDAYYRAYAAWTSRRRQGRPPGPKPRLVGGLLVWEHPE